MPKLYPPVRNFDDISNEGEREVLNRLMQDLPEAARIYHNFDLLTAEYRSGSGARVRLNQGEIDVIILLPSKSLVVVEVKGRGLRYNHDMNVWERSINGRWKTEDSPFSQALRNTHRLLECLNERLGHSAVQRLRHGYMVVFPFSRIDGPLLHDMHPAIYCDVRHMNELGRRAERVAERMAPDIDVVRNDAELWMREMHKAIIPEMHLVPSIKAIVDSDVNVLLRLTRNQVRNLDLLSRRSRALITGVAGSGKTVLAVEQARRFAEQGKRVLLLCFNSALASWIGAGISNQLRENPVSGTVEVRTFHDFCASSCQAENIEFNPGLDQDVFWRDAAPELLFECHKIKQHFDAIIVDEGQDFHGLWWLAIQECLKPDGALFVFYDPQQNIFNADGLSELAMDSDTFPLLQNFRNTKNIARFCNAVVGAETESHLDAPEGENVVFKTISNEERRVDYVRELLNRWVLDNEICPSKIAVLSPNKPAKTCLANGISDCRVSLTTDVARWRLGQGVIHSTVRSFKGLDAEYVILVDLPAPGKYPVFGLTDYYVGASRAMAVLHVVAKENFFDAGAIQENRAA